MEDLAEELHKPVRRKFRKRKVLVKGLDKIWAADLIDMQAFSKDNDGKKFLLVVIDIFSKYGWIIPLKDKTGKSVEKAFKNIFKDRKPEKIWTDKGREFYNKDVKALVEIYSTENKEKSSVVERWIRTMKEKMWKHFTAKRYIDVLPDLVKEYKNTKHSSIKMSPIKASKKENEDKVFKTLYPDYSQAKGEYTKTKFSVGDKVRIAVAKKDFEKGYTERWTDEVFIVSEVKYTSPVTYKIKDLAGEEIKGTFYEPELQKTKQTTFEIEKIVMKDKDNRKSLVKWKGDPAILTWLDDKVIKKMME